MELAWTMSILSASVSCLDNWLDDDADHFNDDDVIHSL